MKTKCLRCGLNEEEAVCSRCGFRKYVKTTPKHNKKCKCRKCRIKYNKKPIRRIRGK